MPYAVVTGGAGFIGSHLVRKLISDGFRVGVVDNFSYGRPENLSRCDRSKFQVHEVDLRDFDSTRQALKSAEVVFHLAADPDVKSSGVNPAAHYENNLLATYNVLEAMRLEAITPLVFTSSSVVYGEADVMPTPEEYPLHPISIYGATKLAGEAMITGYCESFGLKALILRPANIIGENGTHGVILDFIRRLRTNTRELEILGDGTQQKSYLHISDFISAVMASYHDFQEKGSKLAIYNVGNNGSITVTDIAKIVVSGLGLQDVRFKLTAGADGGRGWPGDVKTMLIAIDKLAKIGWQPSLNSQDAVTLAIKEIAMQTTAA